MSSRKKIINVGVVGIAGRMGMAVTKSIVLNTKTKITAGIEHKQHKAINTTIGILGIFDAADNLGFSKYEKEDYGQTLGKWGIGPGCYLILPVLGPSTVRDTAGSFINVIGGDPWYNASIDGNNEYLSEKTYMNTKILSGINFRANNLEALDNLEKNSIDFYASVRSLYLQDRQKKIANSTLIETSEDGDWEEIESQ